LGSKLDESLVRVHEVVLTAPSAKFPGRPEIEAGPATFISRPNGTWKQMFGDVPYTGGSHGALANDVLGRFTLLLDYPGRRIGMRPSGKEPDASASMTRVGISISFRDDGCPEIRGITDHAAKDTLAGVKVDDVLRAIDGQDACKMWHHEISAALA